MNENTMNNDVTMNNAVTMRPQSGASLGRIDQYELIRELGGGGFGCVYLAKDTVAGIEVAVKGLPPLVRLNKEELENVRKNFALVSRLHHPNIAAALTLHPVAQAIYDDKADAEKLRVFSGDTLVVMQYAPGVTLSQWRKQFPDGKVPLDKALEITRQIASALDYAHKEKIRHRDIKPANVMIETAADGKLTARVLDFGLAAEIRSSMGRVSQQVCDTSGTRPYMAPEQWLGKEQGRATDQYALAVLFCELMTGKVPFASVFETGDPVVMMNVVGREEPELTSDLPKSICAAILKALAKKREDRFDSCLAFVDALAGKGSRSATSGKFFGKIAAIGLLVAGLAGGVWYWQDGKAKEEARIVAEQKAEADRKAAEEARRIAAEKQKLELERTKREDARLAAEKARQEAEDRARKAEEARIAVEKEAERKAELEVFRLSSKAQSAHDLIDGESSEIKEFFASEIRAIENDRRAGHEAKANSKYVIATNFYAQALMAATALKGSVTKYQECKELLPKIERAKERADEVKASESVPSGYKSAQNAHSAALDALKQKRFDESKAKMQEAEKLFASLRNDVINAVLELAEGHKTAERWELCKQEAEKVLKWEKENQKAIALKEIAEKNLMPLVSDRFVEACRSSKWDVAAGLIGNVDKTNVNVQFYLGVMYANGEGVTKDDYEAVKWYRKAAEQGDVVAQYNLGVMYDNGRGVTKDDYEAVKWYRKAAEQGYARAQYNLGVMYANGEGVTKDDYEAVKWYRKAAEQGNAQAQYNLGVMYDNGRGVTKDDYEEVKWYRKAAEQGYAAAQCNLGFMYENGEGVTKDDYEAVKWYRKAAEQGEASAQYNLGLMYDKGRGVTKDEYEAVKWYRKAAEQGHAAAQCNLGFMYENGRGVTKDEYEAVKWYRKAAEQGHAAAQYNLGLMYDKGRGVTKDEYEAVKWYRKAAEQGDADAKSKLKRLGY